MTETDQKPALDEANKRFVRNLDWNLLKIFTEIARNDGLTNAARAMNRQQPSVSSALKRLEEYMEKTLCDRGPAGFALTEHGQRLFEICDNIEQHVSSLRPKFDEIDNDITVEVKMVSVCSVTSERLDLAIERFGRKYPRSTLIIDVLPWPEVEKHVLSGNADFGICPAPKVMDELDYTYLCTEHHLPVCGRKHALYSSLLENPEDLVGEAFIIPGEDEAAHIRQFRERHGWGNSTSGKSYDYNEVRRMVLSGLGIALLPLEFVQKDLDSGNLWALSKPIRELRDDIFVVSNSGSSRHWIASRFCNLLPELR